jgi:hypothetical protein
MFFESLEMMSSVAEEIVSKTKLVLAKCSVIWQE